MKWFLLLPLLSVFVVAQELKIEAEFFKADEKKGVSFFRGNVYIKKQNDELNASEVYIYTDKNHKPTKFQAQGDVSFAIETKKHEKYRGKAQKVIYIPKTKEYSFFGDVHLMQVDKQKEIKGDEVVLQTVDGKAYAKGKKSGPVIMIFDIGEE